jgi:hypothetical protein
MRRREPEPGLQAGKGERWCAGCRWDDRQSPAWLDCRAPRWTDREPAGWQLQTTTGTGCLDPQTRWRGTPTRHPNVVDPLVQQAITQVLEPILDPTFSGSSFGFRPGRGAHDALRQAQGYVADGHDIVVDLDLEKFFDRVNHDILMARLARRIGDKRLLHLVRRFLQAGMMVNGVCEERGEGTPQGWAAVTAVVQL